MVPQGDWLGSAVQVLIEIDSACRLIQQDVYRKNIIIVYQTDPTYGGVAGSFSGMNFRRVFFHPDLSHFFFVSEHYLGEINRTFPNKTDQDWILKNSYVQFQDQGGHVDIMMRAGNPKNGILDQMVHLESPSVSGPSAELRQGYQEGVDEASGVKYYYNAATGESTWERPVAAAIC